MSDIPNVLVKLIGVVAPMATMHQAAATAMFSAESLVSSIAGGLISLGVTQYLKNSIQMNGAWAAVIALLVSLLTAIAALAGATIFEEKQFSYDQLPAMGMQVFGLATLAYKLFLADAEPTDNAPTATAPVV